MGTEQLSAFGLLTGDREADWDLGMAASTQYHKRGKYHIVLVREKIQIQNSMDGFYWM